MASPSTSFANPEAAAASHQSRESKRKKRRKIGHHDQSAAHPDRAAAAARWRSQTEERIYATKLATALTHSRREPPPTVAAGSRVVRDTADRVLATAAKGRTRWSRAILTGRLSLRLSQINKRHRHKKARAAGESQLKKPAAEKKRIPPLQKKVRVLGRLVPGCRKVSFPNLLEEATDYIAALQMQVRAMTVLSELLTSAGGNNNDGGAAVSSQP